MVIMEIDVSSAYSKVELKEKRENLLYEQRKKDGYSVANFVVVRTTNHLEYERMIRPLCHLPFIVKNNNIVKFAIQGYMDESDPINIWSDEDRHIKRGEMIKNMYLPYSSQYRSTVHFSVNGLVSSHAKGNFSNRNFIIIDPLEFHLKNNDIRSFRLEDTFMAGDVKISPEAVIMIKKGQYKELLLQYPQLSQYNIVLFTGPEKEAVEAYLISRGIIPEKITEHGAEEHICTSQIKDFRVRLKEMYEIDSEPHYLSQEYREDDMNSLLIWDYYNNLFYSFLLTKLGVTEPEYSARLSDFMDYGKDSENKKYIIQILKKIGLNEFKKIVDEFNFNILRNIANGTFQNNEIIVNGLSGNQK